MQLLDRHTHKYLQIPVLLLLAGLASIPAASICTVRHVKTKKTHFVCSLGGEPACVSLTVQAVVLFVGALAQDGGGAVVEDGGGLYGRQAACSDGASASRGVGLGWAGMCF